jgi:hypothetical protein
MNAPSGQIQFVYRPVAAKDRYEMSLHSLDRQLKSGGDDIFSRQFELSTANN